MTAQVVVSDAYETVEDLDKAETLFSLFEKEDLLAISTPVVIENAQLDLFSTGKTGIMVAAKEKTYYIVSGGSLTEEVIWQRLNSLAEQGVTIALFGAKTVAGHFSEKARVHRA